MPFDVMPEQYPNDVEEYAARLIRRAETLIHDRRHWTQMQTSRGHLWWRQFCVEGALMVAATKHNYSFDHLTKARGALNAVAQRYGFDCIVSLNDHINTTHKLILTVLREARMDLEFRSHVITS
jgi:hypothetical protein